MHIKKSYRIAIFIAASLAGWLIFFAVRLTERKFGDGSQVAFIAALLIGGLSNIWANHTTKGDSD